MANWDNERVIARAARRGILPQAERLNLGGKKKAPAGDWLVVYIHRKYLGTKRLDTGWVSRYSDDHYIEISRDFRTEDEARRFVEREARRRSSWRGAEWISSRFNYLYCHRSVYESMKAALTAG
jgi:hypothetical protein